MAGSVLVDTNVLVYMMDPRDLTKRAHAARLISRLQSDSRGVLSQQVLSEFARVSSERVPEGPSRKELIDAVGDFGRTWRILPVTPAVIAEALGVADRTGRSFWDAQLIATAKIHGVPTIVSEDFEDGWICEGVRFVNPFADGFDSAVLGV